MDKPFLARLFGRRRWNYTDLIGILLFADYLSKGYWLIAIIIIVAATVLSLIIESKYFPEYSK